jgi:hypothetical protein
MNRHKQTIDEVIQALATSFRQTENLAFPSAWKARVLREIRRSEPSAEPSFGFYSFHRLVWQFSLVTLILAVGFSVFAWMNGVFPERELVASLLRNPLEVIWYLPPDIL